MPLTLDQAVSQLSDRTSAKRRSAAKRLRTLADPAAGAPLLDALHREVADPRTWETQYQMIMALGTCEHDEAAEILYDLADQQTDYTTVGVALGDALLRIEWATKHTLTVIDRYMPHGAPAVIDGTFRATAMLHLVPDDQLITRIVDFVTALTLVDPLRYWVAAAAAGWSGPAVEAYLRDCLHSQGHDLPEVAAASLAGRYLKHRPL